MAYAYSINDKNDFFTDMFLLKTGRRFVSLLAALYQNICFLRLIKRGGLERG